MNEYLIAQFDLGQPQSPATALLGLSEKWYKYRPPHVEKIIFSNKDCQEKKQNKK